MRQTTTADVRADEGKATDYRAPRRIQLAGLTACCARGAFTVAQDALRGDLGLAATRNRGMSAEVHSTLSGETCLMRLVTVWCMAMSVFLSPSSSEAVYEVGKDHYEAGVGNSAAASELAETVVRMGGGSGPVDVPQARPQAARTVLIAQQSDLKPIVDWVTAPNIGRAIPIAGPIARELGLATGQAEEYPSTGKAYKASDTGAIYAFCVIVVNGRREIVLSREKGDELIAWHASPDGRILGTARVKEGNISPQQKERFAPLFEETVSYFFKRLPKVG